jgi:predicted MFS family arabinose efflux permease
MARDDPQSLARGHAVPASHWGMLFLLTLMSVGFTMDRQVPMIIAEAVKKEFALSDSQLGLFTGLSYSLTYAIAGVLIGPVVDRRNRSRMLAGMLFLWSGLTAVAGVVTSFVQLLGARLAVGASEAGASPISLSIIADLFPPVRRGLAIGLFKIGTPLGYFAASAMCGAIAARYGWRAAFFAAGFPGLLLTLALLRWLPEPKRGAMDAGAAKPEPMPLGAVLGVILRGPGIGLMILGLVIYSFANVGAQAFIVPYMQRGLSMSLAQAAAYYGVAAMIGGLSPILLGLVNDRATRRGVEYSAWVCAGVGVVTMATGLVMANTALVPLFVGALTVWQVLMLGISAINYAALLTLSPPAMRGTLMAILLVGTNLIGIGLGPVVTGMLSDRLGAGGAGLRQAIIIMISLNIIGILAYAGSAWQIARQRPPA